MQAAAPGQSIVPLLQERLGMTEAQVRGGLGALLVFARERLTKQDFDDLAETIPNADRIMQEIKLRGVVNGPLDDKDDYEAARLAIRPGGPRVARRDGSLARTGHPGAGHRLTRRAARESQYAPDTARIGRPRAGRVVLRLDRAGQGPGAR